MELTAALTSLMELSARVAGRPGRIRADSQGLIIDNPTARGALTVSMMVELATAVLAFRDNAPAVIRIRGTEGAFCSGGHLDQVRESLLAPGAGLRMAAAMTAVLDALRTLPAVVVAEIDGPALGGGAELATAADHRLVGARGSIGFVHTGLGVVPGWGGTRRLVGIVGERQALRLLTAGVRLDGPACVRVGLADAHGELPGLGETFLAPVLGRPPSAVMAAKRQVLAARASHRDGTEAAVFDEVWGSEAHVAALDKALNK